MGEEGTYPNARLETLSKLAAGLGTRIPRVRDPATALRFARGLDLLLRNIAIGPAALDLSIGEGLAALSVGLRAMDLGYSNIGDYAREELGMNASTAVKMARLARRLQDRPVLRAAVRSGQVSARKAEVVAPVAVGEDEVRWVLRATAETVRSLKATVKAPPDADDEEWVKLCAEVSPEQQPVLDEGLRVAGIVVGARSTKMDRVKAWAEEYLGSHQAPPDDRAGDGQFTAAGDREADKARLEQENGRWADLAEVEPVKTGQFSGVTDPWRIDAELKQLVEERRSWDVVFGHVAMVFKRSGAWDPLGYKSFGHYCEEALGMAERAIAQRVALEVSLERIPALRRALREKRISYEKARIIARHAESNDVGRWIESAEGMTCVALRRALQDKDEAQMCARGTFAVWMTVSVAEVVKGAFRAARAEAKRWLRAGDCVVRLAEHFIETWKAVLKLANTLQRRIRARDRHCCQVPGCSRPAVHAHHIKCRSHGGSDDPSNLISLCAAHHLHGIHGGRMRVTGTAPDGLRWEFGLRRIWSEATQSSSSALCGLTQAKFAASSMLPRPL